MVINDREANRHWKYPSNTITTAKYNWWTFIFVALVQQFRKISNLYFALVRSFHVPDSCLLARDSVTLLFYIYFSALIYFDRWCSIIPEVSQRPMQVMAISFIPALSPINPASSVLPLVFVVGVAIIKEAIEDYVRRPFYAHTHTSSLLFSSLCFPLLVAIPLYVLP